MRPPLADSLSPECKTLKQSYGQCKRNLIDMRKRFRGPMPVNYSRHDEGGGQLYGGLGEKTVREKPALGEDEDEGRR
jgi:cytochrome c oxidase assembly factor 5